MAEMKFEEALKKLEKIVAELEDGDLSLDEALEKYEEGIRLSRVCSKKLEAARKKVEILLKDENGSVELREFDEKTAEEIERSQEGKKRRVKTETEEGLL
jgi:exodeoxyribonuclease VII small subunit